VVWKDGMEGRMGGEMAVRVLGRENAGCRVWGFGAWIDDGCAMDWMSFLGLDRWLRGFGGMGWGWGWGKRLEEEEERGGGGGKLKGRRG